MDLREFLANYFPEENIGCVCGGLNLPKSGGKDELITTIVSHLDGDLDRAKIDRAIQMIFDCAFRLDEKTLRKACDDVKLDSRGPKAALLNRIMARIVWPKSVESVLEKEENAPGGIGIMRARA